MIENGFSVYSQFGEDGVLQYLIRTLNLSNKQCCEFGMSGITFSNTFNLVENYDWLGVFIEKNENELKKIKKGICINKVVEVSGINSLDNILSETPIECIFDILSIDVDGIDYHIWDSVKKYFPNIVVIEVNPFIPFNEEYINDGTRFSSSFKSLIKLGKSKGYSLVCMTGNLIFVRDEILLGTELENYINYNPNKLFLNDAIMIDKKQISFKRYIKKTHLI